MANLVQIQSVTINGDAVDVTGTVDGVQVGVRVWLSVVNAQPNLAAKKTYCRQRLRDTYLASFGTDQSGTFADSTPVST